MKKYLVSTCLFIPLFSFAQVAPEIRNLSLAEIENRIRSVESKIDNIAKSNRGVKSNKLDELERSMERAILDFQQNVKIINDIRFSQEDTRNDLRQTSENLKRTRSEIGNVTRSDGGSRKEVIESEPKATPEEENFLPLRYYNRNGLRFRLRDIVDNDGLGILSTDNSTSRIYELSWYSFIKTDLLDESLGLYTQIDAQMFWSYGVQAHIGAMWAPNWLQYESDFIDVGLILGQSIGLSWYAHSDPYDGFYPYGETQFLIPVTIANHLNMIPFFRYTMFGPKEAQGLEPGLTLGLASTPFMENFMLEISFPDYSDNANFGGIFRYDW